MTTAQDGSSASSVALRPVTQILVLFTCQRLIRMTDLERQCEEIKHHRTASMRPGGNYIRSVWRDIDTMLAYIDELIRNHNIKDQYLADDRAQILQLREDHDKLTCEIHELRRPSDAKEIAEIQERDRTVNWPVTSKHWLVETPYGQACLDRRLVLHALAESQRDNARWLKARDCWQAEQKVWIDRAVNEQQRADAAEKRAADLQQYHDWAEPQVQRLGREVVAREAAEVRAIQLANILANVAREWEESADGQIDGAFLDDAHKLLASPLPADTKEPPYYVRSFWSPCRKYIVTACVPSPGSDICIVDDDGKQWEATGPSQDMTALAQPQADTRDIVAVDHEGKPVYALAQSQALKSCPCGMPAGAICKKPTCLMLDQPQAEQIDESKCLILHATTGRQEHERCAEYPRCHCGGEQAEQKQITADECFAKCTDYSCVRMGACTGEAGRLQHTSNEHGDCVSWCKACAAGHEDPAGVGE